MKKKLIIAAMAMFIVIGSTNASFAAVAIEKGDCKGTPFAGFMEKVQHYIVDRINWEMGRLPEWSMPEIEKPETPGPDTSTQPSKPTTPAPAQPSPTAPTEPSDPTAPTTPAVPSAPTAPTESTAPTTQKTMAARVVSLTNRERQSAGLSTLKSDSRLTKLAQMKAEDMAENNYFSHTSPTYGSAFDMMNAYGVSYKTAGENIAKGQKTAESVMTGWMNSSGHRANILNSAYIEIGVGYAKDKNGTTYWVQIFAG